MAGSDTLSWGAGTHTVGCHVAVDLVTGSAEDHPVESAGRVHSLCEGTAALAHRSLLAEPWEVDAHGVGSGGGFPRRDYTRGSEGDRREARASEPTVWCASGGCRRAAVGGARLKITEAVL